MKKELIENPRKYFEDKFIERYGEGFDFSEFVYVDYKTKCKIGCPIHGEFEVCMKTLFGRNRKFACAKCCNNLSNRPNPNPTVNQDVMVKRIKGKFGDRIDLRLFEYKGCRQPYQFICTEHGEVSEKYVHALLKSNNICHLCTTNYDHLLDTRGQFLEKVYKLQTDDFRFILPDEYIDPIPRDLQITCWCPNCGRKMSRHKRDLLNYTIKSCNYCNRNYSDLEFMSQSEINKPCSFYQLKFYKDKVYQFDKVGITRTSIVDRFAGHKKYGYTIKVVNVLQSTVGDCLVREHEFMEDLKIRNKQYKVHDLKDTLLGGWTECFIDNESVAELTIQKYCQNDQS